MPPAIPASTKISLTQRLRRHAQQNWPQLTNLHIRYHGQFAYVEGELPSGERLPLIPAPLQRIGLHLGIRPLPG